MKENLNENTLVRIADNLSKVLDFDTNAFVSHAIKGLEGQELKQRITHIITIMHAFLPSDFAQTAKSFCALAEVWDRGDPDDKFRGFAVWPVIDYVGIYGIDEPELALLALEKLTHLFSAEFAIRPFIEQHPKITFEFLNQWLSHPDEHVRRLVSEGTRPRLPWAGQLKDFIVDPTPVIPLLAALRHDNSQYVKRSVANHLNDIGKDHPEKLIDICAEWQEQDTGSSDWVIKHATRSLVKSGHPQVFRLLGYSNKPKVSISHFKATPDVLSLANSLNERLEFSFELESDANKQSFVLDYAVHFTKANGKTAAKVFKFGNYQLDKGERLSLNKSHSFKPISTRKYYPGEHILALHINGEEQLRCQFTVSE
ncbi:MAG: DNA alkylation repair protein [Alteromonadaceae bacterium]|nr:MAG: DNA alkylation repair protein [Alteromonadaceae bacterium]